MKKLILSILTVVGLMFITACNEPSDSYDDGRDTGKLILSITDDPFNISFVESATVTITKVEIRKADDSEEDPFILLSEDTITLDLLTLRNGITEELVNIEIPKGEYDLVRLYVDEASLNITGHPMPFTVKVPGGSQTGIKIFIDPALHIEGGLTSELLLDFDLSKSFVMRGKLNHPHGFNGFIFKPCIRASNLSTSGRIAGIVSDSVDLAIEDAKVWIEQDTVFATAFSDSLGYYAFIGIPAGTYSMYAHKESYDTAKYEGITVTEGNLTNKDITLLIK